MAPHWAGVPGHPTCVCCSRSPCRCSSAAVVAGQVRTGRRASKVDISNVAAASTLRTGDIVLFLPPARQTLRMVRGGGCKAGFHFFHFKFRRLRTRTHARAARPPPTHPPNSAEPVVVHSVLNIDGCVSPGRGGVS